MTSFLTAVYMFRLVFLAFHGRSPQPAAEPPPAHPGEEEPAAQHAAAGGHHGAAVGTATCTMRRARWPSRWCCWPLARWSAGYVGVPQVLGGANRIEHFLAPSFTVEADGRASRARSVAAGGAEAATAEAAGRADRRSA